MAKQVKDNKKKKRKAVVCRSWSKEILRWGQVYKARADTV